MKIIVAYMLIICLFLSACSVIPIADTTSQNIGINEIRTVGFYKDNGDGEYDKYLAFISTEKRIPNNFVTWEKLSFLGEWQSVGFPNYYSRDTLDDYYYTITGTWGTILYIDHTPDDDPYKHMYPDVTMPDDMITMLANKRSGNSEIVGSCDITRNGFVYRYVSSGDLVSITWYVNGIEFALSGDWHKYPDTETETVIGRLLSVSDEDFNSAVAEIMQKLK